MYWLAISDSTVMGISLQQELLEGAVAGSIVID